MSFNQPQCLTCNNWTQIESDRRYQLGHCKHHETEVLQNVTCPVHQDYYHGKFTLHIVHPDGRETKVLGEFTQDEAIAKSYVILKHNGSLKTITRKVETHVENSVAQSNLDC